jgi:hypothetical protein
MRTALTAFLNSLDEEVFFDEAEGLNLYRKGGQWAVCTDSAVLIVQRFGGIVLGYYSMNNPLANIGLPLVEGHDFALIGSRWLVDYWAWNVAQLVSKPIFDLFDPVDESLVLHYYGSSFCWQAVKIN